MRSPKRPAPRPPRLAPAIQTFALASAPGHLLRRCHQRSEELFTAAVGPDGPTRQQVALLISACQHPDASQADLVALTGIDKNTLTQMINRLTERGLLERRRSARDARTNAITATPAALALLEEIMPKVRAVQDQIIAPLPKELRPIFKRCLQIIAGLDAAADLADLG
jgi:DNA-binding MarR family transcriptional regulator